ncbi:hypothetical protein NS226_06975 [Aureimonas ureilytica]|uniref:Uncharacterized protein n=1 Tax=Aureimonas ureilytica TaxID=401562 RepID=A0A175RA63_9HYPH|nr:hypothetical protein [Aureimonas ureilytica]KTQ96843.1 hypothetical protein NS226_06975 [Aureimonas ureilytica]
MSAIRNELAGEIEIDVAQPDAPSALFDTTAEELSAMFRGAEPLPLREGEIPAPANEGSAVAVAVAASSELIEPMTGTMPVDAPGGDWTQTLSMVEQAAGTIRSYEKRFAQLEKQNRALADRAAEEHQRAQAQIQVLEERLKAADEKLAGAEVALRNSEYNEWETSVRAKRAEQRAEEAEARARQAEAYLRRVHELMAGVS